MSAPVALNSDEQVCIQAVHLENRIVLAGTIQAQIVGHPWRGDSAISRGEKIAYRFAAIVRQIAYTLE